MRDALLPGEISGYLRLSSLAFFSVSGDTKSSSPVFSGLLLLVSFPVGGTASVFSLTSCSIQPLEGMETEEHPAPPFPSTFFPLLSLPDKEIVKFCSFSLSSYHSACLGTVYNRRPSPAPDTSVTCVPTCLTRSLLFLSPPLRFCKFQALLPGERGGGGAKRTRGSREKNGIG